MTRPSTDYTTYDGTYDRTGTATGVVAVVDRVDAALSALTLQYRELVTDRPVTEDGRARRCAAIALLTARRAGWWRVLTRYHYRHGGLHPLFYRAALSAYAREQSAARFWRDTAQEWQARAEHRPTSDAAGALSNWHEWGVRA